MKLMNYCIAGLFVAILFSCEKETDTTSLGEENSSSITNEEEIDVSFVEDGSTIAIPEKRFLSLPDYIFFDKEGLYPEGIEFDFRRNRFLVGSLGFGDIGTVSMDGEYTTFIQDEIFSSTVGLHIDNIQDVLYVAISDRTGGTAGIASYDLKTKKRMMYTDLSNLADGISFANDMITDYRGNLYITDSRASAIYKIDDKGEASVFLQDPALVPSAGFGLNGITFNPRGFLLVATSDDVLFKVPTHDPESFTIIDLDIEGGIDGLQITGFNTIYGVVGSTAVYKFRSTDNFETIDVVDFYTATQGENTTTIANSYFGTVYAVNSYLSFIGSEPPVTTFSIEKVRF